MNFQNSQNSILFLITVMTYCYCDSWSFSFIFVWGITIGFWKLNYKATVIVSKLTMVSLLGQSGYCMWHSIISATTTNSTFAFSLAFTVSPPKFLGLLIFLKKVDFKEILQRIMIKAGNQLHCDPVGCLVPHNLLQQ